jgi:hypothetical protein
MEDKMKAGNIWEKASTYDVSLFDTVTLFRITVGVLNGEWKREALPDHYYLDYIDFLMLGEWKHE